jgi:hypothetical protein
MFGQAANLDTGKMTSDYYNQVLAGLDPQRQAENSTLANTLFSQGRTGAGAGVQGGYVNPEQFALLKAREQANAGIYLTAEDRARQIQQEQLKGGLGFVGLGNELKTAGYALPTSLFGTGVQLGQINNPLIAPSLTGGQYVTYENNLWVACGSGTSSIATSTDGIVWTSRNTNSILSTCTSASYGNGLWVVTGTTANTIATSSDAITWTGRSNTTTLHSGHEQSSIAQARHSHQPPVLLCSVPFCSF